MLQSIHNKSDRLSNFVPGLAPRGNGGRSLLLRLGRSVAMPTSRLQKRVSQLLSIHLGQYTIREFLDG